VNFPDILETQTPAIELRLRTNVCPPAGSTRPTRIEPRPDSSRLRTRPNAAPRPLGTRRPLRVLYADPGLDRLFHSLVKDALEGRRAIQPVWVSHARQVGDVWERGRFDLAIVVLKNLMDPAARDASERVRGALARVSWMRSRSPAPIVAVDGSQRPEIGEAALRCGAELFLPLPFPSETLLEFIRNRFG